MDVKYNHNMPTSLLNHVVRRCLMFGGVVILVNYESVQYMIVKSHVKTVMVLVDDKKNVNEGCSINYKNKSM